MVMMMVVVTSVGDGDMMVVIGSVGGCQSERNESHTTHKSVRDERERQCRVVNS